MFLNLLLYTLVPYAISNWLIWQNLKLDTNLPKGSSTSKHGLIIGWSIKLFFFGYVIKSSLDNGWINLLVIPITWFVSGWLATSFERIIYMRKVLDEVKWMADYYSNSNPSFALQMVSVPQWWLDLMPRKWKNEYYDVIQRFAE